MVDREMNFDEWFQLAPSLSRDEIKVVKTYLHSETRRNMKEEKEARLASRLDFYELHVDCDGFVVEAYPGVFSLSIDGCVSASYGSVAFAREVSTYRSFYIGAFMLYEHYGRLMVKDGEMDLETGVCFYGFRKWVQDTVSAHEEV